MADRNTRRTRKLQRRDLRQEGGRVRERVDQQRPSQRRVETRDEVARRPQREVRAPSRSLRRERQERRGGGVPWWVWLLGLAALGLIAFMIIQGLNDDGSAASGGGGGGTTQGTEIDPGTAGTVVTDGTDLLPLASDGDALAAYEGATVEATEVTVESVTGDETFWIGSSSSERLFVFLDLAGESGPDIDPGDEVSLSGTVEPLPVDFEDRFEISSEEGAEELEDQGRYIEVTEIRAA